MEVSKDQQQLVIIPMDSMIQERKKSN